MTQRDTIVAAATPPGKGGVAVVRVSGSRVPEIADALLGEVPPARQARFTSWSDAGGDLIDTGALVTASQEQPAARRKDGLPLAR